MADETAAGKAPLPRKVPRSADVLFHPVRTWAAIILGVLPALLTLWGVNYIIRQEDAHPPRASHLYIGQSPEVGRMLEQLRDATPWEVKLLKKGNLLPHAGDENSVYVSIGDVPAAEAKVPFTVLLQPGHRWQGMIGRASVIRYDASLGLERAVTGKSGGSTRFYGYHCELERLGRLQYMNSPPFLRGCTDVSRYWPSSDTYRKSVLAQSTRPLTDAEYRKYYGKPRWPGARVIISDRSGALLAADFSGINSAYTVVLPPDVRVVHGESRLGLAAAYVLPQKREVVDEFCRRTFRPGFAEARPDSFLQRHSALLMDQAPCNPKE